MLDKVAAINKVLDKYQAMVEKRSMARGVLVLDENAKGLEKDLKEKNIKVVKPTSGTSDECIKKELLPGRIFVTNNSKDFIDDASSYEYGIIALEGVEKVPVGELAEMISKAIIDYSLWSKRTGFLLLLRKNKKHRLQDLTE